MGEVGDRRGCGDGRLSRVTWERGSHVLFRHFRHGVPEAVSPTTVVSNDADGLLLWLAGGTSVVRGTLADGREVHEAPLHERAILPKSREPRRWRGTGILIAIPPDEAWSVWWFFASDGTFANWYGNLEDRHVRWADDRHQFVDTSDHALDVEILPDLTWRWKDEDEFAAAHGLPGYWDDVQAGEIRAAGKRLIALAESGTPPFDGRWTDFQPDPSWPIPPLPTDWDRLNTSVAVAPDGNRAESRR